MISLPIRATLLAAWLAVPLCLAAKDKKKNPDEIGNRDVGKGVNLYSIEREIAWGRQLAQEVERQARFVEDPLLAEYINRLGQNLARHSDTRMPLTVRLIDADDINGFALPGGHCFLHSGVLAFSENEAELAGVLAHEVAHVAARHGTRQASRETLIRYASLSSILLGGWTGYGIQQAAGLAVPVSFLAFSRGFEEEADLLGLQYVYRTGYDPAAYVDFFERMETLARRQPGKIAKLFRTHPLTADRLKKTQQNIQENLPPKPEYVLTTSEFDEMKARLLALRSPRRPGEKDAAHPPRLRRMPGSEPAETESERPTLKRRPQFLSYR